MNAPTPFESLVIRDNRRHITRADYQDTPILLDLKNVILPKTSSLEARALSRLIKANLSHRGFDDITHSYRLGAFINTLRDKGWTIVNHDAICSTKDFVPRKAKYTLYELFATFTAELQQKVKQFCKEVDRFEAAATASVNNAKSTHNNQNSIIHSTLGVIE